MKLPGNIKDIILFTLAIGILLFSVLRTTGQMLNAGRVETNTPTLVFSYWWQDMDEILDIIKDNFQELYPDIRINLDYRPYDELRVGDFDENTWDIVALDPKWIPDFVSQEKIEDEEFPLLRFFHPLFYNIEILRDAGFNRPPRTRTEFLAQTRAITNTSVGLYGIAFALGNENFRGIHRDIYSWIWEGGMLLDDFELPVQSNRISTETRYLIDTLEFLVLLQDEGILFPGTFSLGEDEKRKAFLEGKIAFMISSAEDIEFFRQELGTANFDYTAIPVPDLYSGRPIFGSGGWNLAIARKSEFKDEARIFINYLMEQSQLLAEGWAILENGNFNYPMDNYPRDQFYSKAWELYINGDLVQETSRNSDHDRLRDRIFRNELIELFNGRISSIEAAGRIQSRLYNL